MSNETNIVPEKVTKTAPEILPRNNSQSFFVTNKLAIIISVGGCLIILLLLGVICYLVVNLSNSPQNTLQSTPEVTTTSMIVIDNISPTAEPTNITPDTPNPTPQPSIQISTTPVSPTVIPVFRVTNVSIQPEFVCAETDGNSGFPYSQDFPVTGSITTNGPGTVTYKWQPNPATLQMMQTVVFDAAGTKTITPSSVVLTLGNWQVDYAYGSMKLTVFTPNSISSDTVELVLNNNTGNVHPCP